MDGQRVLKTTGRWADMEMLMHPTPMPRPHEFTAEPGRIYYFGVRAMNTMLWRHE